MNQRLFFTFVALFVAVQLLAGCAPSTVGQLQKGSTSRQLSAKEILTLTSSNTLFLHGHKIDSYFFFDDSGITFARDIFANTDVGRWDVSDKGELCFKMENWWMKELRCFPVYIDEDKFYLFNNSGVLEFSADLTEGDSQELYHDLSKSRRSFLIGDGGNTMKKEQQLQQSPETSSSAETSNNTDATPEPSEDELKSTVKWMAKDCPDCNLKKANLAGADLVGAQLEGADLTGANLTRANLRRANLKDADLEDANLTYANLPGANLQDSDLEDADFTGANLIRADLTGADIDGAIFKDALLEGVEGLQR